MIETKDSIEAQGGTARPRVRTFDVFDTLITRRCAGPASVFNIVERERGVAGFAAARCEAESSVAHRSYDIDAIYAALGGLLSVDRAELNALKAAEIEVELRQVIPIEENLRRVEHGDLLISDTYLGEKLVRRLLEQVGFDKKVGLVARSDGTSSADVWSQILASVDIDCHLSDNARAESGVAHGLGIPTELTDSYRLSPAESLLAEARLPQLAALCREARLATWSDEPDLRALQEIQADLNFPILFLASVVLGRMVASLDAKTVLFSSRDCDVWIPLFERVADLMGIECSASYFYTNRKTRTRPSEGYLEYARSNITDDTIVVDLCGTGWSLGHLAERLGVDSLPVFLLHQGEPMPIYERIAPVRTAACEVASLIPPAVRGMRMDYLEMANYTGHATVADVRWVAGHAMPVFGDDIRSEATRHAIATQRSAFDRAVAAMGHYDLTEVLGLDGQRIRALVTSLYETLSGRKILGAVYGPQHGEEDRAVMAELERAGQ